MKMLDYEMRVKFSDNSCVWTENNGGLVEDYVTIGEHARATIAKYNRNKKPGEKKYVFIVARLTPLKIRKRNESVPKD